MPRAGGIRSATIALVFVGALLLTGGAAPPQERQFPPPMVTTVTVIDKKVQRNYVHPRVIADCSVTSGTGRCVISKGYTATREVQVAFGLGRSWVTGQLGIQNSTSVTLEIGCTSEVLTAGQTWKARSKGTKYTYKIQRKIVVAGRVLKTEVSKPLTAFSPSPTSIACGIR
jgi:hypothetical protein